MKLPLGVQRRPDLQGVDMIDMSDTTGEGWAFHPESTIVWPLTMKKRLTKLEVIRLFNASDTLPVTKPSPARRLSAAVTVMHDTVSVRATRGWTLTPVLSAMLYVQDASWRSAQAGVYRS